MTSQPTQHLILGPLDHLPPRHYTTSVVYIPLKPHVTYSAAFSVLQEGLRQTFLDLPWLNGKVVWQSPNSPGWRPGQLEVQYVPIVPEGPAPWQLKYRELETDMGHEELRELGFPTDAFADEDILWAPFEPDMNQGADVFVGQATFIPGGCIVCASIFHSVVDGMAEFTVFKLWADRCQGLASGEEGLVVGAESADRGILEKLWRDSHNESSPAETHDATTWGIIGLDHNAHKPTMRDEEQGNRISIENEMTEEELPHPQTQPELRSRVFYISGANLVQLKKECSRAGKLVSGNDAVCALLWRGLMRARFSFDGRGADSVEAKVEMTVDGRPYLSLPPSYLGNVVLISTARMSAKSLCSPSTTLAEVAEVLRNQADAINPSSALEAYSLARSLPRFDIWDTRSNPVDGRSVLITSLLTMPTATIGFGDNGVFANDGKAEGLRTLMGAFNKYFRICFVMPPKSYGGIEIIFNLFDEELDLLLEDHEFTRFAMQVN
ncbi:hypothetical protein B0I35DRAFT_414066 [Stachybotrys elegans]|uniref:Trichothecene 3-O-acetyltransferase-like N-terminal domain-containing protein n=1 Tax=Stachybotrys elegans TaxID=80388 RepID=A0A8K0SB26_9HYPO|nr:hypothetical protein B0I35DRAFT_414066 [Stachybotrys elegans]